MVQRPEALFDRLTDTVFFTKDAAGHYVSVNQTLVQRLGQSRKHDVIGLTAAALFPPSLAARITAQDQAVIIEGQSIQGELELHLYPDGHQDWCLTWKEPLRAGDGTIIGLRPVARSQNPSRPAAGHESPVERPGPYPSQS